MTRTYDCYENFSKEHQAVVHIDGTARPQIISPNLNNRYYSLKKLIVKEIKKGPNQHEL